MKAPEPVRSPRAAENETPAPARYPSAWALDTLLVDGSSVHIRPIRPTDASALASFHRGLSPETVHRRFFGAHPELAPHEADRFSSVDYDDEMAFVVSARGKLVAVARYERVPGSHEAELALVVTDTYQGKGVGTVLIEQLGAYAREHRVERLVAETLVENGPMLGVLANLGLPLKRRPMGDSVVVTIDLAPTARYLAARDDRERRAISASLEPLLSPQSIAVVGASRQPGSAGHEIVRSLLAYDFTGRVYPVNPSARSICGVPAYRNVGELPEQVDLAVIAVPARAALEVVRQCAAAGTRALAVVSSGFAETGEAGGALEAAVLEVARDHGVRLLGPNCLGLITTGEATRMNATFSPVAPTKGSIALASQSGAVGVMLLERVDEAGLGVSGFVSTGNKADVSSNDLLCAWERDDDTSVIALYLESFGNPRKFTRIARRVARHKPVVALKSGTSAAGARGARSHSAAAATPAVAVDSLLASCGAIQVTSLDELVDVVTLCASAPLPAGRRVALVGNSGGPLVLGADACEHAGLVVPELSPTTAEALLAALPPASASDNPIDITSGGDGECLAFALRIVLDDPAVDAAIAIVTPLNALSERDARAAIERVAASSTKPIIACLIGRRSLPQTMLGSPVALAATIPSPDRAANALARVARYAEWLALPDEPVELHEGFDTGRARALVAGILDERPSGGWLDARDALELLQAAGIPTAPTRLAADLEEATHAGGELGYPLALKSASGSLVHKTDVGGVVLGIVGPIELAQAFAAMRRALGEAADQVVVQKMVDPGVETIVGISSDALFGPLVICGLGGVPTDVLGDHSFAVPPISLRQASEMLLGLRSAQLLTGYRGSAPVDLGALAAIVARVATLSQVCPEIVELDCNPVVASTSGAIVLDVKVRLEPLPDGPDQLARTLRRPRASARPVSVRRCPLS